MIAKDATVNLDGMTQCTKWGADCCDKVFVSWNLDMVVTSARDSHGPKSLHYHGRAFDLRLPSRVFAEKLGGVWEKEISDFDRALYDELVETLGPEFQVLLEEHQASPYDWHIHVELDPK